jgi:hypothetical protein
MALLKLFPAALMTTAVVLAVQPAPGYGQTVAHRLYVSATNESGAPVRDLRTEEFELRESGERRDISRITVTHRPIRIALVVDTSWRAGPVLGPIRSALHAFFDAVDPQHEIVLITTGGMLRVRVPPTTDRKKLKAVGDGLFADGGNVLLSALLESYDRFLRFGDYEPIFVVMTLNGHGSRTHLDNKPLDQLGKAIRANSGVVHAAVLHLRESGGGGESSSSSATDVDVCAVLANATDGLYTEASTVAALANSTKVLAQRINQDYVSSPPKYEIEYQGVSGGVPQVVVARPGVRIAISAAP